MQRMPLNVYGIGETINKTTERFRSQNKKVWWSRRKGRQFWQAKRTLRQHKEVKYTDNTDKQREYWKNEVKREYQKKENKCEKVQFFHHQVKQWPYYILKVVHVKHVISILIKMKLHIRQPATKLPYILYQMI